MYLEIRVVDIISADCSILQSKSINLISKSDIILRKEYRNDIILLNIEMRVLLFIAQKDWTIQL